MLKFRDLSAMRCVVFDSADSRIVIAADAAVKLAERMNRQLMAGSHGDVYG